MKPRRACLIFVIIFGIIASTTQKELNQDEALEILKELVSSDDAIRIAKKIEEGKQKKLGTTTLKTEESVAVEIPSKPTETAPVVAEPPPTSAPNKNNEEAVKTLDELIRQLNHENGVKATSPSTSTTDTKSTHFEVPLQYRAPPQYPPPMPYYPPQPMPYYPEPHYHQYPDYPFAFNEYNDYNEEPYWSPQEPQYGSADPYRWDNEVRFEPDPPCHHIYRRQADLPELLPPPQTHFPPPPPPPPPKFGKYSLKEKLDKFFAEREDQQLQKKQPMFEESRRPKMPKLPKLPKLKRIQDDEEDDYPLPKLTKLPPLKPPMSLEDSASDEKKEDTTDSE